MEINRKKKKEKKKEILFTMWMCKISSPKSIYTFVYICVGVI